MSSTANPGPDEFEPTRLKASQAVLLVAGRELNTKLRTRAFVIGTVVSIVAIAGFLLIQSASIGDGDTSKVGLSGQA
ncbi:MAG: hypothetical protein ABW215_01210, partial [Kibdelosporangium sp.]